MMSEKVRRLKIAHPDKPVLLMIRDFLIAHREVLFQCVLAVALFMAGTYRIQESIMPILLDDEYGYWSNSAFLQEATGRRLQVRLHIILMDTVLCLYQSG